MQKNSIFYCIIFLVSVLCGVSCKKYEVRNEGAWTDAQAVVGGNIPRSIVYVDVSGVWACTHAAKSKKLLVSKNPNTINRVSISPDYTKIAYKEDGIITVIDSSGKVLQTNIAANNINHIDWYHDSKMLYGSDFYTDKVVALYGGTLPAGLPPIVLPQFESANFVYITKENDLLYNNSGYSTSSPFLVYIKNGSNNPQYLYGYATNSDESTEFHIANNCTTAILLAGNNRSRIEIKNRAISKLVADDTRIFVYPNDDCLLSNNDSGIQFQNNNDYSSLCTTFAGCYITNSRLFDAK